MTKQTVSKRQLLERVKILEGDVLLLSQEINKIKNATHEHSISPETILHLADIIKNDIVSSSLQEHEAIESSIEEVTP